MPGITEELEPEKILLRSDKPRDDSCDRGCTGDSEPRVDAGDPLEVDYKREGLNKEPKLDTVCTSFE